MGDVQAFACRRLMMNFASILGLLVGTGAFDTRRRTIWVDALLHLQSDGRNRHFDAAGKTSLEEGRQHCFDCQSLQLRAFLAGESFMNWADFSGLFR